MEAVHRPGRAIAKATVVGREVAFALAGVGDGGAERAELRCRDRLAAGVRVGTGEPRPVPHVPGDAAHPDQRHLGAGPRPRARRSHHEYECSEQADPESDGPFHELGPLRILVPPRRRPASAETFSGYQTQGGAGRRIPPACPFPGKWDQRDQGKGLGRRARHWPGFHQYVILLKFRGGEIVGIRSLPRPGWRRDPTRRRRRRGRAGE